MPGFTWTLKACRVNLTSYACENSVTYTKTNFTSATLTAWNANTGLSGTAQAQLVRLDLTYTADSGTTNRTTTSTIELARGGM
ncbi:hypothetical protein [Deinococcus pimensis]|uniref:hypothetical protein n=1 Tax=Deinococcus pimensis TaxID=309888 RepID=UPI000482018D|nr:hypothetical protein [Deinococcus pimensis]